MKKELLFFLYLGGFLCGWLQPIYAESSCNITKPALSIGNIARDVILLNKNLFSWDSFKILTVTLPFFIIGSMGDKHIHRCFYDRKNHKNLCQMHPFFHGFAQYGFAVPVFFSGVLSLAARDLDLKTTSRVFFMGFPFVMLTSSLIKQHIPEGEHCLRPWHERFSKKKRACGGFPSGHAALASFTAFLYGLRFGPSYALPLGAYVAWVSAAFINCNRHYTSQIIAGIGLGALFACAASKLVDTKLARISTDNFSCEITHMHDQPAMQLSYHF